MRTSHQIHVLLLLILPIHGALAITPVMLDKSMQSTPIVGALEIFSEGTVEVSLDEVITRKTEFVSVDDMLQQPIVRPRVRFKVRNPSQNVISWKLVFQPAPTHLLLDISSITFYVVASDGTKTQLGEAGYRIPFHSHPITFRYPTANITTPAQSMQWIYVRFERSNSTRPRAVQYFAKPFKLWATADFTAYAFQEYIIFSLLIGGIVFIGLYNLVLFFAIRDSVYLYYVVYSVSVCLLLLFYTHLAPQYLYPDHTFTPPIGPRYLYNPILYCVIISAARFAQIFLQMRVYAPALNRLFNGAIALFSAGLILITFRIFVLPEDQSSPAAKTFSDIFDFYLLNFGLIGLVLLPLVGAWTWWRGLKSARYYVLAWTVPTVVGAISVISENFFQYPIGGALFDYILATAIALECILLSFALADRINVMRIEKSQMRKELLTTQKLLNEELEQQVAERTSELEAANEALLKLSNEDGLTKLFNRRYFDEALEKEWRRLQREDSSLSLIMCDIDHFKKFNDTYGHQSGDLCIQQVAQAIRLNTRRPADVPARYGGEEFAIILPQTALKDARYIAESVRQEIEHLAIPHKQSTTKDIVSMSFGVASIIPSQHENLETLVAMADEALYVSKSAGRDRVSIYDVLPELPEYDFNVED
ncbi:MAG: diguanylate cyclase [Pseudomonadota bacterium]